MSNSTYCPYGSHPVDPKEITKYKGKRMCFACRAIRIKLDREREKS